MLSAKARQTILGLQQRYPQRRSALLPALFIAQKEAGGWLPPEVVAEVAALFDLTPADVQATVSYYSMFYRKPMGKYVISICNNLPCSLLGAESLVEYLEHKLGIRCGETTPDGRFTLLHVECLGACAIGPMMLVNETEYGHLTPERIDAILAGLPE